MARFLANNSYLFGAVMIVMGGFLCLFGRSMLGIAIFVVSATATFLIGTFATFNGFQKWDYTPSNVVFWVIISAWAIAALLVGTAFHKLQKYGVIVMSMVTGSLIGHIIATFAFLTNNYAYWGTIGGFTLGFLLFSSFCQNNIRIFITSFIGAYGVTRGIASYLGGFPNEIQLQQEMMSGKFHFNSFPKSFYVYFVAFIFLIIVSCVF